MLARLWLPVAIPLIIVAPIAVLSAFSARFAGARRIVERLAPRPFARALLRHPEIGRRDSSIEDATVMFTDMVGSTALAERLGEDAFRTVMNRYYSAATAAVEANDGIVVEYMGDGILALFTSVVAGPDHATKACLAAQQIRRASARTRRAAGGPGKAFGCASAFIPGTSSPGRPAPSTATASRRSATASSSRPGWKNTARRCGRTARTLSC